MMIMMVRSSITARISHDAVKSEMHKGGKEGRERGIQGNISNNNNTSK